MDELPLALALTVALLEALPLEVGVSETDVVGDCDGAGDGDEEAAAVSLKEMTAMTVLLAVVVTVMSPRRKNEPLPLPPPGDDDEEEDDRVVNVSMKAGAAAAARAVRKLVADDSSSCGTSGTDASERRKPAGEAGAESRRVPKSSPWGCSCRRSCKPAGAHWRISAMFTVAVEATLISAPLPTGV